MHERVSANAICFPGESLAQVADHWRELQPRRVSLWSVMLLEAGAPAVREVLAGGGYGLETITHSFLGMRPVSQKEAWGEARETLGQTIQAAQALGARSIYMLTGGHGALSWEQAAECFAEAVAPCVAQARDAGVALLIESASPVYADLHLAHTLRDTVQLAEMAGIGVCIDIATCWTEAGLEQTIERATPNCGLIQVSDYVLGDRTSPARAVPGDGAIPLERLLGRALDAGYAGAFDLELIGPRIDQEGRVQACRRAGEWIGAWLDARGG